MTAILETLCPKDMEDPLIAMERAFVLLTREGAWYLLPNVSRSVLAKHINRSVRIEGDKYPRYNSIWVRSRLRESGKQPGLPPWNGDFETDTRLGL